MHERDAARRALMTARKLLDEASEMGASPLTVAAGRTCVAFYLGEGPSAASHHKDTLCLLPKSAPPSVVSALASNGALVAFLAALEKSPAPALTDDEALGKWGKKFARGKKAFAANAPLADVVARVGALPKRDAGKPLVKARPQCKDKAAAPAKPLALPAAVAPEGRKLGACPAGWKLAHTLPSLEVASRTGSPTGVTTCIPQDGRAGMRWVSVDLPGVTSPPMDEDVAAALGVGLRRRRRDGDVGLVRRR
ncbi:MAG: hypothetical protein RIT45_3107 [Pseudomonadota bacterium]